MRLPAPPVSPFLPGPALPRRQWLAHALGWMSGAALAGCASAWPPVPPGGGSSSARQRLRDCAQAHGGAAWSALNDVNLAVAGLSPPADTDAGPVQARWLPAAGVLALQSAAPSKRPFHWHRWGDHPAQRAWRNTAPLTDPVLLAAAAQQAEWLRLWWLGPAAVLDSPGALNWAEPQTLDGRRCDHLHLSGPPGPGGAAARQWSLFIDREQGWLRRLRVPTDDRARGVVDLDLSDHQPLHGVLWPRRCQLSRPSTWAASATVAWQLTGLDVNRGYPADTLAGAAWSGAAAPPARPWPRD